MVKILSGRSKNSLSAVNFFYSNINFIWFDVVVYILNIGVGVVIFRSFTHGKNIITCEPLVSKKHCVQVGNYGGFLNE